MIICKWLERVVSASAVRRVGRRIFNYMNIIFELFRHNKAIPLHETEMIFASNEECPLQTAHSAVSLKHDPPVGRRCPCLKRNRAGGGDKRRTCKSANMVPATFVETWEVVQAGSSVSRVGEGESASAPKGGKMSVA